MGDYAPGVVLVGFSGHDPTHPPPFSLAPRGTSPPTWEETWGSGRAIFTTSTTDIRTLHVPLGQECSALEVLRQDPGVAFAELDHAVHALDGALRTSRLDLHNNDGSRSPRPTRTTEAVTTTTPDDPGWTNQWGPAKVDAPAAWDVTSGTSDVVVAVLDTGVQLNHEDLADNLWTNPREIPDNDMDDDGSGEVDDFWGWHFYHKWTWDGEGYTYLPKEDNQVGDDNGHGTHVAGIAGVRINNGVGITGMAGNSRLMVVKVLDQYGDGWYSDLAQGIVYAVDNGARIINLSVGGEPSSQTLQAAVDYAYDHGVLVVAAAGNNDPGVLYPAACEHALAVAATDRNDQRAGFSNHGPEVDVAAPGVDIYSTWYRGNYFTKSGTSVAAPHVSGLAALMWSAQPDLTAAQVTEIITDTAEDVNGDTYLGWDKYLGWGRIEAGRALSMTTHGGDLRLTASHFSLPVGGMASITATLPATAEATVPLTFTAKGGAVAPEITITANGRATTTLVAGPLAGTAVVTAATEALSGTLSLRLLPGPAISATLAGASRESVPGSSVPMTLRASDSFGNAPLDGTFIDWSANGGTVSPPRSTFRGGEGRAAFTPELVQHTATITASLPVGTVVTTTIDVIVDVRRLYLPVVHHQTE